MKRLAILGASGHGRVVADAAECTGWNRIAFYDDAWPTPSTNGAWPVYGSSDALLQHLGHFDGVVVAIGNNALRAQKQMQLAAAGAIMATIIHPSAVVSPYAAISEGTVVFAAAVINIGAHIGRGVVLNTGCTVDHDCVVGDFAHISPGGKLAGGVHLGQRSWLGVGACVRHAIHIGNDVVVGAGAAVVTNIPDGLTVVGVPARPLHNASQNV